MADPPNLFLLYETWEGGFFPYPPSELDKTNLGLVETSQEGLQEYFAKGYLTTDPRDVLRDYRAIWRYFPETAQVAPLYVRAVEGAPWIRVPQAFVPLPEPLPFDPAQQ